MTVLLLALTLCAGAQEAGDARGTPLEFSARDPSIAVYLGSGQGASGGTTFTAGELGAQRHGAGRKLRSEVGVGLTYVQQDNTTLPVFVAEAGARFTPWPSWRARPFVSANLGAALLVIVPFPTVNLQLGAEIGIGSRITLEPALVARQVFNPYGANGEPVTVTTARLGVGF